MRYAKIAAGIFAVMATLGGPASAQMMNCPVGTYPWTDSWGNPTCRSHSSQQDVMTGTNPVTGMPNGAMPSVDSWGNPTPRGSGSTAGRTSYDTSGGCPIGTHPWVDSWGDPTCRRF